MRSIYLSIFLFISSTGLAYSQTGVLVEHVPAAAEPGVVVAVVKQAFLNRRWSIQTSDETSVTGVLDHSRNEATLRIFLVQGRLLYEGSSIKSSGVGPPSQGGGLPNRRNGDVPKNWIANLKRDISMSLATIPDRPR